MKKVAIIMGSDSDWPILKPAYEILMEFGIKAEVLVASAHRNPNTVREFVLNSEKNGISILIAGAGAAAHLPGVIAAYTTLPVIGVPISSSVLKGMDALLSIVQMPSGIPVATMAIDGGKNAGLFALSILSVEDKMMTDKLKEFREKQARQVEEKNKKIQENV